MTSLQYQAAIRRELEGAKAAYVSGNDGLARVCARRAAGIAAEMYIRENHFPDPGPSALNRLNYLAALPQIPLEAKKSINYLTERVNENFELPSNADLIAEAQKFIKLLFPEIVLGKE